MPETIDRTGEEALRDAVRALTEDDLDAIVRIDKRIVGHSRRDYLALKLHEALEDTRIRVSLGVEVDGHLVGFLMGRLYYGEFGVPEPVAILDTIGVDPERPRKGIGRALLHQYKTNLRAVGIESIQTRARWDDFDLLQFLAAEGFEPAPYVSLEASI
ncbi:MAG: GNAT family N-acetyltransferase [Planctomycetota bacterium]|jgi:predicted N-acetyltransferase YhbS